MKNYLTKNLLYVLFAVFLVFLLVFKIASADTPGGMTVPQGGTGNTNYPLYLPVLTGTNTLRFASATSTLYLKIGGVLTPIFTATSTGSYFIAGAVPLPIFGGINDVCFIAGSCASLTTAQNTIMIGSGAGAAITTASGNVGLGLNTLTNATAAGNTAVGFLAGSSLTTGLTNCFFGFGADTLVGGVTNSCAIGENSLVGQSNFIALGGEAPDNTKVGIGTSTSWSQADLTINTLAGEDGIFVGSTTPEFLVDRNGRVGIGTSSPSANLAIVGGFFTTASSTGMNGINLTDGCFSVKGTCVGGSGGSGSGTVNSGLIGQVAYYATSGTAVSGTSTLTIASTTANVGVGSTTPWGKFSVGTFNQATNIPAFVIASSSTGVATTTQFVVTNGIVGINTVNPAPAASRSGIVVRGKGGDGTSEIIAQSTSVTDGTNGGNVLLSSGNDGYIYNRQSGNEYIGTNNAQQITILGSNGFVGVNKSVPAAQLDVSGTVETEGSVGGLQFDSRTGSGSNFQWYDPAGADARLYNSSTGDVITVLQNGHTGILCSPNSGVTFDVCDSSNTTESQIYNTSSSKAALLDVFNSSGPEMQAWAIGTTYPGGSYFGHGYASTLDLISVSGTMQIGTFDANSLVLGTNNTAAVTLDSSQALTYRKDQNTNTQFTIQNANAPGAALMHFVNDTSTFDFGYGGSTNAAVPNQGYFFGSTGVSLSWWSNATKQMTLDTSGNLGIQTASPGSTLDVNGTITTKELVGGGNAPTATLGAGAGTSPTMTIIGSDLTGTIYLTTGTGPSNGVSNVFTMTFLNATTNTRTCSILNGVNHAAWANQNLLMASSTKTTLVVTNESTISALPASTLLIFTYFCPVQ